MAIDIAIKRGGVPLWGRILAPSDAHASFTSYFSMKKPPLLSDPKLAQLSLPLQVEIGAMTLMAGGVEKVEKGRSTAAR